MLSCYVLLACFSNLSHFINFLCAGAFPLHVYSTQLIHHSPLMAELLGGSQQNAESEGGKVPSPSGIEPEIKRDSKRDSKKRKDSKSQPNPEPKR